MIILPQGTSDVGNIKGSICLVNTNDTSDYGVWVDLGQRDKDFDYVTDVSDYCQYIVTKSAIYRRSLNYWYGSPYGWRKVDCTNSCKSERRFNFLGG